MEEEMPDKATRSEIAGGEYFEHGRYKEHRDGSIERNRKRDTFRPSQSLSRTGRGSAKRIQWGVL